VRVVIGVLSNLLLECSIILEQLMHLHKLPWRIFAISFAGGMGRPSPNTNGLDLMSSFPNDNVGGSAGELIVN